MITNKFELPDDSLLGTTHLTRLAAKWGIAVELLIFMLSKQTKGRLRKVNWTRNINLPYLGKQIVIYKPDTSDYQTWKMTNTDAHRFVVRLEIVLQITDIYRELDVLNNALLGNNYAIINRKRMLRYVDQIINIMGFVEHVYETTDTGLRQFFPKMILLSNVYEISSKECIADNLYIRIPLAFLRICDVLVRENMPILITGKVGYIKKQRHCEIVSVNSIQLANQDLVDSLLM